MPYHQQADGLVECSNQTLTGIVHQHLEPLLQQKDWMNSLSRSLMAYNMSKHASTGFTPFYLLHGYEAYKMLDLNFPSAIWIPDGETSDVRV